MPEHFSLWSVYYVYILKVLILQSRVTGLCRAVSFKLRLPQNGSKKSSHFRRASHKTLPQIALQKGPNLIVKRIIQDENQDIWKINNCVPDFWKLLRLIITLNIAIFIFIGNKKVAIKRAVTGEFGNKLMFIKIELVSF